jgi:hypothetical protein
MPYKIGEKGSYGCSGYPALKEGTNEVMGCHETREAAAAQIYAINQSEGNVDEKDTITNDGGIAIKDPQPWPGTRIEEPKLKKNNISEGDFVMGLTSEGIMHGQVEHIMWEGGTLGTPGTQYAIESMPPENPAMSVRVYEEGNPGEWKPTAYSIGMMYQDATRLETLEGHTMNNEKSDDVWATVGRSKKEPGLGKAYEGCGCPTCKELNVNCENCPVCQANGMKSNCCGDMSKQAPCWDGYVQRGMKPGEGGAMVPNCVPANKSEDLWEDSDDVIYETDSMSKAEGYSPPEGARNAAKRAIRWKEEGKAKGAGTMVGWTRAGQLARGETLSLSTVKRMYSYFSRHEVDKKGKDFYNTSNPSNGRIMWEAWGGDTGYSWSRRIAQREADKSLFGDFGQYINRSSRMTEIFKSIRVGSMVSWNSSGGRAEGKIIRIIRDGRYNVPNTEVTVTGTPEEPAAVIRLYRDGEPTDIIVAHKIKTLREK